MNNNQNNNLEQLYTDTWQFINQQADGHTPMAIAGVLVAQALTLYKTLLTESEFNSIVDTISDTRDRVPKVKLPELQ